MATIIGIVLLFAGTFGQLAASITYFHAELDLFAKRPDLAGLQDDMNNIRRRREVARAYKSEFPQGRKIWVSWVVSLSAFGSFFLGLWVLATFQ